MEIGEEDLVLAQKRVLLRKGLLHLDDHVGFGVDSLGRRPDLRPGAGVLCVGDAGSVARGGLDQHRVPVLDQALHSGRHHGHPVFVILDFLRNADDHARAPRGDWIQTTALVYTVD